MPAGEVVWLLLLTGRQLALGRGRGCRTDQQNGLRIEREFQAVRAILPSHLPRLEVVDLDHGIVPVAADQLVVREPAL